MDELLLEIKNDGLYSFIRKNVHDSNVKDIILTILDMATERLSDEDYEEFKNAVLEACLNEEDSTADELAYKRYVLGLYTYEDYLNVCEEEGVEPYEM